VKSKAVFIILNVRNAEHAFYLKNPARNIEQCGLKCCLKNGVMLVIGNKSRLVDAKILAKG
jgi:hypothetical protein